MELLSLSKDPSWPRLISEAGLPYHSFDGGYWRDDLCLRISPGEASAIAAASDELHRLCVEASAAVCASPSLRKLFPFPEASWPLIKASIDNENPSLYGRFDLTLDKDGTPKMYEYNADTPTSLPEAGPARHEWLARRIASGEIPVAAAESGGLESALTERFSILRGDGFDKIFFACLEPSFEDFCNVEVLVAAARRSGVEAEFVPLAEFGFDGEFHGSDTLGPMPVVFKLYPWEMMFTEALGEVLATKTLFIEPAWKVLPSCKAMLPVLWELFPGHPNLIEASFSEKGFDGDYVSKPLLSREGANVDVFRGGERVASVPGPYGAQGRIFQRLVPTVPLGAEGLSAVIGSWMVGGRHVAMGCRGDSHPVSSNGSLFIPHAVF